MHRELLSLVLSGLPTAEVLRIATINGARAFGMGDRLGSIEAGKWADLVIVRGNPLDDIRNVRNPRLVIKAGRVYDPATLMKSVEGKAWTGNGRRQRQLDSKTLTAAVALRRKHRSGC